MKVGDRVKLPWHARKGTIITILSNYKDNEGLWVSVKWDDDTEYNYSARYLEQIDQIHIMDPDFNLEEIHKAQHMIKRQGK